jgi:RNA polymerase sigma-70 factor (ECF subfamily)
MEAMSTSPPSPESLLADVVFARRLARRLVRDTALADDLAQEAWLRAQDGAPRGSLQAWLGGIVRNLARQHRRSESRRARREAAAARPEALPSAAESLERLAAQQDVVRAVLALPEPYRSTVVLRFHDGLPPRAIAARHGVPVATVKTRLARGLAQLRAALAKEHGGEERALAAVLVPLVRGVGTGTILGGATVMSVLLKVGGVSVVALLAVWAIRREGSSASPAAPIGGDVVVDAVELAETEEHVDTPALPQRESEALPVTPDEPSAPAAPVILVRGRVLGVDGMPIGGVELGLRKSNGGRLDPEEMGPSVSPAFGSLLWSEAHPENAPPLTVSGNDGHYELALGDGYYGRVVAVDALWESVLVPFAHDSREGKERILLVAPRFGVSGTVVDGSGAPLAGVELRFGVPRDRLLATGVDLEDTMAPDWSTTSDAQGRFELPRLPAVPGAKLRARLEPYVTQVIQRDAWSDDHLELALERASGAWLEGVVEAGGQPIASAVVSLGSHATRTDAMGRFQIHLADREDEDELCAAAAGHLPARIVGDREPDGSVRWPGFVRIALAGEPLALGGIVVDAEGRPLAGQEISLGEGRTVVKQQGPIVLESVLAGGTGARPVVKSDASGAFVLRGLEEREYELIVVDPRTALVSHAGPFAAGRSDLRLLQPTDRVWPVVRGVVVSRSGEPLAGIGLHVESHVDFVGVDDAYHGYDETGSETVTAADGSFELAEVPMDGARIANFSMELVDPAFELPDDVDPLDVRVVVDRWVQLEVHAPAYTHAESFAVRDDAGQGLLMESALSGGTARIITVPLVQGRSPVVKVNERAATIVLLAGGEELVRAPLALHATGINRVDL